MNDLDRIEGALAQERQGAAAFERCAQVRLVAAAGIRIFSAARDEAAAKERQRRIRGER